jgi:integrase
MSVRREKRRDPVTGTVREFWRVDVVFQHTDGRVERVKKVSPVQTRRGAEEYERQLRAALLRPAPPLPKEVPTLDAFFPRFIEHGEGEYEKASSIAAKKSTYRVHLSPAFGSTRLDAITDEQLSRLRARLAKGRTPRTVNNILTVLNSCLKLAIKWKVLDAMPCTIEIRAVSDERPDFYDFEDYDRLCEGAAKLGTEEHALVRLGGDGGLRRGEMMALRWCDCDFKRRQIRVEQAAWKRSHKAALETGEPEWNVAKPKGGRGRVVPMTDALLAALQAHRHLRGEYVLCLDDGSPVPGHTLRDRLEVAQRRAGLAVMGSLHKLRHTFCSHLAMRGAPAKAIQELAGHQSLSTTLRYMHLSPSALDAAIGLLNERLSYGHLTATEAASLRK